MDSYDGSAKPTTFIGAFAVNRFRNHRKVVMNRLSLVRSTPAESWQIDVLQPADIRIEKISRREGVV
jgi:hypothetical protein